jgi:hypothetical protein
MKTVPSPMPPFESSVRMVPIIDLCRSPLRVGSQFGRPTSGPTLCRKSRACSAPHGTECGGSGRNRLGPEAGAAMALARCMAAHYALLSQDRTLGKLGRKMVISDSSRGRSHIAAWKKLRTPG